MTNILEKIRKELHNKKFKMHEGDLVLRKILKKKYDIIELVKLEAKSLKLTTVTIGYKLTKEVLEGEFEYCYMEFEINKMDNRLDLVNSNYEVGAISCLKN